MSKIIIDYLVLSDTYNLTIVDQSNWGLAEDGTSIIEITLPGSEKIKTYVWDKMKTNVFNSNLLGITCPTCTDQSRSTLPDGIYTIDVKASPEKFHMKKFYLKTDLLQMEIDKFFLESKGCKPDKTFKDNLTDLEFLIESAHAHLRWDDITRAGQLFQTALQELEDLKGCKQCK